MSDAEAAESTSTVHHTRVFSPPRLADEAGSGPRHPHITLPLQAPASAAHRGGASDSGRAFLGPARTDTTEIYTRTRPPQLSARSRSTAKPRNGRSSADARSRASFATRSHRLKQDLEWAESPGPNPVRGRWSSNRRLKVGRWLQRDADALPREKSEGPSRPDTQPQADFTKPPPGGEAWPRVDVR
jgi:hypothetical protein